MSSSGVPQLRVLRPLAGSARVKVEPLMSHSQLVWWLDRLRPPNHLALEAIGPAAIFRALKALASSGPLREPARFVPVNFEVSSQSFSQSSSQISQNSDVGDSDQEGRGRRKRGIRFLVAPASSTVDPWKTWSTFPALRLAAKMDVARFARALLFERKMRSRQGSTKPC
ncbi:unnamed protein product [Durusdinium trenchii]|uniref:Uncharacterized protein n=1 Tax=Durusdinium trenchii TaxID=1381693 RepID=A0ABP0HFX8_9DINO